MEAELKQLIVERLFLEITPAEIATDTPLADYGVDSFLLQELVVGVEEQFGVRFTPKDMTMANLRSVAALRDCIARLKARKN